MRPELRKRVVEMLTDVYLGQLLRAIDGSEEEKRLVLRDMIKYHRGFDGMGDEELVVEMLDFLDAQRPGPCTVA